MDATKDNLSEPRYRAEPTARGFVLDGGADRQRVRVNLLDTCWQVVPEDPDTVDSVSCFGLFELFRLIGWVTHLSLVRWAPRSPTPPHWRLKAWVKAQARRSIAWVVGKERQRLLATHVDPLVLQTQRAVFAACSHTAKIVQDPDFFVFADRHLLADIQRYRAAAIAVSVFGENLWCRYGGAFAASSDNNSADGSSSIAMFRACQRLESWRTLFSDTGRTYSALNVTLDKLPGGISPKLVAEQLSKTHLARPMLDRLELSVLLLSLERQPHQHHRVFQFASRPEILTAMARVGHALRRELSSRRTVDLGTFVQYLCDYPEGHSGNIVGLANRSVRYHRLLATQRHRSATLDTDDQPLAVPPVPLPSQTGLRFLDTAGAVRNEGLLMGHCIAGYVDRAYTGQSYLFHYDHGDEMASIEVNPQGRVTQAYGPYNSVNTAARKAKRLLGAWGRTFSRSNSMTSADGSDIGF